MRIVFLQMRRSVNFANLLFDVSFPYYIDSQQRQTSVTERVTDSIVIHSTTITGVNYQTSTKINSYDFFVIFLIT